jgi:hypothetical protein
VARAILPAKASGRPQWRPFLLIAAIRTLPHPWLFRRKALIGFVKAIEAFTKMTLTEHLSTLQESRPL